MRHSHAKKTIIAFLVITMLLPGVFLAFRPVTPARAQIMEILSWGNIAQWVGEISFSIIETMLYKTLKNLAKSFGEKLAKTALLEFATGQKGQEPLFSAKNWEKEMKDAGNNALGFAMEGAAKGFEKGFKRSQKKYKEDQVGKLNATSELGKDNARSLTAAAKNCEGENAVCGASVSGYKVKDGEVTGERGEGYVDKGSKEYLTNQAKTQADGATAAAQKATNIKSQMAATDKAQKKRDEADRRGQAGGTSDEVAAALNWLCNPSGDANISLKISLGIGNLGSDPDAVPPCTGDTLAKNWGAVYDKFKATDFDKESEKAWSALADMVDPDSSEIGVAFNANSAFLDENQKETMNNAIDEFIKRVRGPDEEDEAGNVKTPGDLIRSQMTSGLEKGQENSSDPGKAMTGKVMADTADIIGTFADSLLSQGMNYLKQGVIRNVKQWQDSLKKKDEGLAGLTDELQKQADADAAKAKLDADKAARDLAALLADQAKKAALPPLAALPPAQTAIPPAETRVAAAEEEKKKTVQVLAENPTDPDAIQKDKEAEKKTVQAKSKVIQLQKALVRVQAEVKRTQDDVVRTQTAVTRAEEVVKEAERQLASIMSAQPRAQTVDASVAAATDALYNPDAAPSHGGIAATKQYLAKLTRVTGIDGGTMNTLAELRSTECTISANACVLGDAFANAIQEKMTVQEAMDAFRRGESAGLNPSGVFGFENQPNSSSNTFGAALQPGYQTNFPYNSLVVLRKYRVLPVSWELAALYIKDHYGVCGASKSCTLQDMTDRFGDATSPFFRLIDPNWVLKMPSMYCALKGYGPVQGKTKDTEQTICKNDTNGDGSVCCDKSCLTKAIDGHTLTDAEKTSCLTADPPTCSLDLEEQTVIRSETCLDEQTCLQDDATGKCLPQMYGYCLEEKKLWRFKGTECKPIFASCDEFADKDTKLVSYYLKDSIVRQDACNADTAGCQWYSKTRYVGAEKTIGTPGSYVVRDWNSAEKAYFTPKVAECSAQAEGCRGIETMDSDGTTSTIYAKIAPSYLKCNETTNPHPTDSTWKPPYRREECKPFALHCAEEYTGCELYTPEEVGGFPIAAKNPKLGCEEACAGLTSYAIQKTRIESQLGLPQPAVDAAFIPASPTVEQCGVSDVGCDEFTNVLAGAGGEQRDYFKEIRRCEKKSANPENVAVFYSPFGSNTGGYSLDKFTVKKDTHGAPACFGSEDCTCAGGDAGSAENFDVYDNQRTNPNVTAINCRQFYVNRNDEGFNPEYYQLDKLIYLTDDCNEYRRTVDEQLPNKGSIYKISPSLSRTCSAESARCRAFRDPTAGNIVMVDYSNFEDGTANGWGASTATSTLSAEPSNESESLGNHSLEIKENRGTGEVRFEKNGLLLIGNVSYLIGLSMKVPVNATVRAELLGYEDAQGDPVDVTSTASAIIPAYTWRYLTFAFPKIQGKQPIAQGSSGVRITITPDSASEPLSFALLDNITLKQASGVIYAIDDSWVLPDECLIDGGASGDKTKADKNQIGCKLYADRTGAQAVFRDVERLCPNEMVGCKTYNASSIPPLVLVEDSGKACLESDNGCTAYGVPALTVAGDVRKRKVSGDTDMEDWITRYLKITPDENDAQRGSCPAVAVGCKTYQISGQSGQGDRYFKDPGKKVCQWRAITQKETDAIMAEIGKPLTARLITARLNKIGSLKKAGKWYYKACSGDTSTACTSKNDCSDIGKGDCTEEMSCASVDSVPASLFPKACPANQRTCRKITDPECESGVLGKSCAKPVGDTDHDTECETPEFTGKLRRDYGRDTRDVSCVRNYYYLANAENKGECNSRLDVEGGCLLFNDANENEGNNKYNSNTWYSAYFDDRVAKDLNAESSHNAPTLGIDANALYKVGLDRMCKTWLECTDYLPSADGKKTICTNRAPCNERSPEDGTCANYIFEGSTDQIERGVLALEVFDTPTSTSSRVPFASLTGMARPDLRFNKGQVGWLTTNSKITGHNSLFGWDQKKESLPLGQLYLKMSSATPVVNSCRVRPRSDAPDVRYSPKITGTETLKDRIFQVNACDFENKKGDRYQGTEGYCIEPYPKFSDTYFSGVTPAHADFASFGFKGACLNWYPAERSETSGFLTGAGFASSTYKDAVSAWQGITQGIPSGDNKNVYFCAEFGVNEHEQTLKNGSGADITLTIPKVNKIPAIGRTINACAGAPFDDGHKCVPAGASDADPESNQNMVARQYKKATMRIDTMTIYHGQEGTDAAKTVTGVVGQSTTKVSQNGLSTESNIIPFSSTYQYATGQTTTFIGNLETAGGVPPNSTSVTSKAWKKVQYSTTAFQAAQPRMDRVTYFEAEAEGQGIKATEKSYDTMTGTTETTVPIVSNPTKGNTPTPSNATTTRTAITVVKCDNPSDTITNQCADGTHKYKSFTGKIVKKFTANKEGKSPSTAATYTGDATSRNGLPPTLPDALKNADKTALALPKSAIYVKTCDSPAGETGNSLVSPLTTDEEKIEGRCADGTKKYKQLPRIDEMQFKNEDGSAITTDNGVDSLLTSGYKRIGGVSSDGRALIRAPDSNLRDTVMTTIDNYKFDKEVVTHDDAIASVAIPGTGHAAQSCDPLNDEYPYSDEEVPETPELGLNAGTGKNWSGEYSITAKADNGQKVITGIDIAFIKKGWNDGECSGDAMKDLLVGDGVKCGSKKWVKVTPLGNGTNFSKWFITSYDMGELTIGKATVSFKKPKCSIRDAVAYEAPKYTAGTPERSRIDKVTKADGAWKCYGGYGDTYGGRNCLYYSYSRKGNQTQYLNEPSPRFSESGQKGIFWAFQCNGDYGTCKNGTRPTQWQERKDIVTYHNPIWSSTNGILNEGTTVTWDENGTSQPFTNTSSTAKPSGRPDERGGELVITTNPYIPALPRRDKAMYLQLQYVQNQGTGSFIPAIDRIEYWTGSTESSLTPKFETGGTITDKPNDTTPTKGGDITGIPKKIIGIMIEPNVTLAGVSQPYRAATFRIDRVTSADPTATSKTVLYYPGGKASSDEAQAHAKADVALNVVKGTGGTSDLVFNVPQTTDVDNDGYLIQTTAYSEAKPRIDKVQYWRGSTPDGNPILRTGTVETTGSVTDGTYRSNCATSYTDTEAYARSSCALTPKSEIDAGEATDAGVQIFIPQRDERPEKDPYTITAKATYRDVYCKRVVQVAEDGKMIPFFSKLPGVLGAQLTPAQVAEIAKGPIILQRIIKGGLARWEGSKQTDSTWTTLSSDPPEGQVSIWSPLNPAFQRYDYSTYDKAANQVYVSAQTNATRTWLEAAGDPIGTNASSTTRLDREQVAIEDAASNGTLVPANSALIKGMTPKANGLIGSLLVTSTTPYIYTYQPEQFNDLGPRLFTQAVGDAIGTLADGGSAKNFDADNFNYAPPAIPFAKYYGQWTSIGIDNTFKGRTGGNGPIAFTHSVTASNWFPEGNTNSKASATAISTYPKIYNDLGVENLFSYVKAATTAPQVRNMVFYVDVDNDHLPLRELFIDWGDGATQRIERDNGEGRGRNDSPPCDSHPWTALNPCKNLKFAYNHIFQTKGFDDKVICIQAMDNWEQITRVCGTLKAPVEEMDTGFDGAVRVTHPINE